MKFADVVQFVARAGRGHAVRTALGLAGIAIGVCAVVLLIALGEEARSYVTREFSALGTNLLVIVPGRTDTLGSGLVPATAQDDLTLDDAAAMRGVRSVRSVAPLSYGSSTVTYGRQSADINIVGTNEEWVDVRGGDIQAGRFLRPDDDERRTCVIGPGVERALFGTGNPLGELVHVDDEPYRVVGVMAPKGVSIGLDLDAAVYLPAAQAMRMLDRTSLYQVFVRVARKEDLDATRVAILDTLQTRRRQHREFTVFTQDALLSTSDRVVSTLTLMLAAIAAISLTVAGLGIMNIMLVSVSERAPEIGLLKAVGATSTQVLILFLVEAMALSAAGGIIGVALAHALGAVIGNVYLGHSFQPPAWATASAILVALTVGAVFGLIPAQQAARRDPVVALTGRPA